MSTYLTLYNLSVKIETRDQRIIQKLNEFLKNYYTVYQRAFGGNGEVNEVLYASKIKTHSVWYIHINQFKHFLSYLSEQSFVFDVARENVEDKREYPVKKTSFKVRKQWKLREDQKPVNEFLMDSPKGSKLVPLNTGVGKTFIALNAVGALKQRMGVIILPSFIDKWVSDIVEIHEATREDVMIVQGAKAIASIVQLAREGNFNNDYVIISSRTMQDFIRMFEEEPETCAEMYGCTPVELFPILGIGILLIDETHMSFHAIFKITLHTNVKFHIGLSATLISEELVVSRAHKVLYPSKNTYGDTMLKRYIDVYPIEYNIAHNLVKHIKTENYGSKFYSHTAFEQSILKKGFLLESYIKLIKSTMEDYYFADYMEGDKLMIFVATVKLASILTERLQDEYPDKVVRRYCEGDPYDEMLEGDIIVTTVISAGTGLDIPNLRVAIQTVSVSSTVSNIQSAGRLRFLKDRDVKFCYLYAANIPKQREYHLKRMDIFKDRAANIVMRRSGVDLN